MTRSVIFAFAVVAAVGIAAAGAQPAADSIDAHLAAAKKAAGFDFPGLLGALCVAPRNAPTRDVAPGPPPPGRARFYTEPARVFDDVYFVGTKDRSSWALTTSDGIILIDTTFEYESEAVIVGGLRKLGLDPAAVKYVIISHAHPGEVGGAKLMQDRFGSRIVIGEGDWEMIERSVNGFPNGKPRRDIVATDGQKITLGGRTVTLMPMPGHTPGTISMIFQVKDNGVRRMRAGCAAQAAQVAGTADPARSVRKPHPGLRAVHSALRGPDVRPERQARRGRYRLPDRRHPRARPHDPARSPERDRRCDA